LNVIFRSPFPVSQAKFDAMMPRAQAPSAPSAALSASRRAPRARTVRPAQAMTQEEMEEKLYPQSAIDHILNLQSMLVRSRYLYQ
jgi:hypothetical protein